MNYFDDKRIQCDDKITTYPSGYFDDKKDINMQIKDNTVMLKAIDNSGIIPKNYNTNGINKKYIISTPIDINKITELNNDIYEDSAKSNDIGIIKSANANKNYLDALKSNTNDNIKSVNANKNYLDALKSNTNDNVKSANANNNYLDALKSYNGDIIKTKTIITIPRKNISNKSAHSKIARELNALLKSEKVTYINKNIVTSKKINHQAALIKHELSMLCKLKKVTRVSKHVINFLNNQINKIISSSSNSDIITKAPPIIVKKAPMQIKKTIKLTKKAPVQIKITHIKINLTNVSKKINIKVPEQIKITPTPIRITNKVPGQIKTYNIEKYRKEHRKKVQ